jgi:DNA polymerase III subunit gamma/tau
MSYIVLARKYRPQTFQEVYSQGHITQILSNAIKNNRIAHAYLFTGPRGVGKTSMARILAKSLNCVNGPTDTPCGECHNCREIASSTSTDVIEIDGASNTGVEDVRELQKELFYAPSLAPYKIYIIDEVHMLSKNAFNALLKTLEEPPENVVFIFATTEPQKVLPTIISRCQRFDFRRIPVEDIVANLLNISQVEQIDVDEESLYLLARKSDGGMRDALSLLDQVLSYADGAIRIDLVREVFSELPMLMHASLMRSILDHDSHALISQYHEIINSGIDLVEFLNSFLEFLRQILLLKIGITPKGIVKEDLEILKQHSDEAKLNNLMYMISLLIQLKQDIKISTNPSISIEVNLIKMTRLDEMEDLNQILEHLNKVPNRSPLNSELVNPQPQLQPKSIPNDVSKTKTEAEVNATIEINYTSPAKVKELTKEHVLQNWASFISKIKSSRKMLSIYLKKENISSVKSDIIFMDCDSLLQYKMVNEAKEELNDLLSKFFDLPVKLITRLSEPVQPTGKHNPTLQDIQAANPALAQLIEMTDALITTENDNKRK